MVYLFVISIVSPIYKLWLRKVRGLENVPVGRSFIIAANHASYYDAILLHSIIIPKINKKIHALVDSSYWRNPIIRSVLNLGECIPVFVEKESRSKTKNKRSIEKAIMYIKKKDVIQIFPEGGRSFNGVLKKAYTGVAKLALKGKVPVLPVGIYGSYKVFPKGKSFPRFLRCEVNIGKLMYFEKYHYKKINKPILEKITKEIMEEIAKLIGQKYKY